MDSLLWIVPLSLALVALAVWAFFWAVDAGQFEDLESPGWSVLEDDPPTVPPGECPADLGTTGTTGTTDTTA